MDLVDSIKQRANNVLPRKHQVAASALLCLLGVIAVLPDSSAESKTVTLKLTPTGLVEAERRVHLERTPAPPMAPLVTPSPTPAPSPLPAILPPVPQDLR